MLRTQETAAPLAKLKGMPIEIDKRLNDIHAGSLEGLDIMEFRKLTQEVHKKVRGSESRFQVAKRLKSFLEDLIKSYPGQTVALVSSEIILHALKQLSQGLPIDEAIGRHIRNGVVNEFHIHSPICCKTCGDRCKI
jgi:broad specificity phosphatase PhoE